MLRNCDIASCEIQTGDMGTPPPPLTAFISLAANTEKNSIQYDYQVFALSVSETDCSKAGKRQPRVKCYLKHYFLLF